MGTKPVATERCVPCKGVGRYEQVTNVVEVGANRVERYEVECWMCKGAGVLPLGYQAEYKRAFDAFWCKGTGRCEDASIGSFHDDGECAACEKHHYHCGNCGKISQVG